MTYTPQEAFDKVCAHIKAQGHPSRGEEYCLYRNGPDKCAIGALIPDDEYSAALELNNVEDIADQVDALQGLDPRFLSRLQSAHDNAISEHWVPDALTRLREVAIEYELSPAAAE